MWQGMYHLCRQTVTAYHAVYHKDGSFDCYRWVLKGVHFESVQSRDTQTSGTKVQNEALLILPQQEPLPRWVTPKDFSKNQQYCPDRYTLQPGDKVVLGEAPEIENRQQWAEMTPEKVDNLIVVQSVAVKYFMGEICHLEVTSKRGYRSANR